MKIGRRQEGVEFSSRMEIECLLPDGELGFSQQFLRLPYPSENLNK
jgi:hypothetical protein